MDWGSQTGAVSRRQLEPWRREAGLKGRGARRENRVGLLWTPGETWRGVLMGSVDTSHVPCKFFRQGACQAGKACPFSHDLSSTTDNVCKYFAKVGGESMFIATLFLTFSRAIVSLGRNVPTSMYYQTGNE